MPRSTDLAPLKPKKDIFVVNMSEEKLKKEKNRLEKEKERLKAEIRRLKDKASERRQTIYELTTPVVKIWEDILILPLIGMIDTVRAEQLRKNLLTSIKDNEAAIAIIDVTGVPIIDTEVANRLLRTIKAASLLGTKCLLVGVRPDIAQSMVQLGIELTEVDTFSSLQAGLEAAFNELGLRVVEAG